MTIARTGAVAVAAGLLVAATLGCGDGAPTVSGTITFDGRPIPRGTLLFMPDSAAGNSGPAGFATITDGAYSTGASDGRKAVSGPMLVTIEGFDPSGARAAEGGEQVLEPLFPPYRTTKDFPESSTTWDFDVPADAADVVVRGEQSGRQLGP